MNEPCHDLLAGARLTRNEHGGVSRGDLRRLSQHLGPLGGLTRDLKVSGRFQTVDAVRWAYVDHSRTPFA